MTSALLKPEVGHPVAVKTEIGARRTRAKQYYDRNLGGKAHEEIQPGQWVYAKPNPQHKHSAWPHGIVQKVSSPRSYTVVTPNGGEMHRNRTQIRLAAAPQPDVKTYMSQQPSAVHEDDQSLDVDLLAKSKDGWFSELNSPSISGCSIFAVLTVVCIENGNQESNTHHHLP